ncbi:MAG: T9SS type A sorting domain-containing protein [Bacteroidales bacterium]|nr:T9SS type A sorting domain-containing protein [Bacteroidales bacterium]
MKSFILTIAAILTVCSLFSQTNATYTFDKQGRLKSELVESVYQLQFTYDAEGNLLHKSLDNYTDISKTEQITTSGLTEIFPNPAEDYVMVKAPDGLNLQKVSFFDISGRELEEWKVNASQFIIDLSGYKKGIYFLKTESGSGIMVTKLVKR